MASNQEKLDALVNGTWAQVSYDGKVNPFTNVIKGMRTDVHDLAVGLLDANKKSVPVVLAQESIDAIVEAVVAKLKPTA